MLHAKKLLNSQSQKKFFHNLQTFATRPDVMLSWIPISVIKSENPSTPKNEWLFKADVKR